MLLLGSLESCFYIFIHVSSVLSFLKPLDSSLFLWCSGIMWRYATAFGLLVSFVSWVLAQWELTLWRVPSSSCADFSSIISLIIYSTPSLSVHCFKKSLCTVSQMINFLDWFSNLFSLCYFSISTLEKKVNIQYSLSVGQSSLIIVFLAWSSVQI